MPDQAADAPPDDKLQALCAQKQPKFMAGLRSGTGVFTGVACPDQYSRRYSIQAGHNIYTYVDAQDGTPRRVTVEPRQRIVTRSVQGVGTYRRQTQFAPISGADP